MPGLMRVVLIVAITACSGCASIVSKSQYPVTICSSPAGASVTVKDKQGMEIHKGITPATLLLKASAGFFKPERYTVKFEKEGYLPDTAFLTASVDNWYIGNLLFGGLIGLMVVDPGTGAMYKLTDTISCSLSPEPPSEVAAEDATASQK